MYKIKPKNETERQIVAWEHFKDAMDWGKPRSGHPEVEVGKHVQTILRYISNNHQGDDDYKNLRLIAILHDIGKFWVQDKSKPHAEISVEIASEFIKDKRILDIIKVHDKYYNLYRCQQQGRTVHDHKIHEYFKDIDLKLLIKFMYSDKCDRDKTAIQWFVKRCEQLKLI